MLKTLIRIGAVAAAFFLPSFAHGQAMPTATGAGGFQVGAGASMGKPDFGEEYIAGISIFGDYNLTQHIGLEGDVHMLNLRTPFDQAENTYEVGPRFTFRHGRFVPYGKVMIGYGSFYVQERQGNYNALVPDVSSFMYSVGGGVDITFRRHITVRAFDLEYQKWPNFLRNGLSPVVGTVGVAYRFH